MGAFTLISVRSTAEPTVDTHTDDHGRLSIWIHVGDTALAFDVEGARLLKTRLQAVLDTPDVQKIP